MDAAFPFGSYVITATNSVTTQQYRVDASEFSTVMPANAGIHDFLGGDKERRGYSAFAEHDGADLASSETNPARS